MRDKKARLNNELTAGELLYVENLANGYTQRQAYLRAFPESTIAGGADYRAYVLIHTDRVRKKYEEIKQIQYEEAIRNSLWTREQAMNEIKYLYNNNKREMDRYEDAYNDEMELLEKQINERLDQINNPKGYLSKNKKYKLEQEIDALRMDRIKCNRRHQANKSVNDAMLQSIIQLNTMMGFNEPVKKNETDDVIKIQFVDNIGKENKKEVKA